MKCVPPWPTSSRLPAQGASVAGFVRTAGTPIAGAVSWKCAETVACERRVEMQYLRLIRCLDGKLIRRRGGPVLISWQGGCSSSANARDQ